MQLLKQCSIYSKIVVKITIVLQQLNNTNTSKLFFNSDSTYLYTKKLQVCETTKILKNKYNFHEYWQTKKNNNNLSQ